jgi:hypothetical protein
MVVVSMVDKETKNKLKEREKLVNEELKHIPKGDPKQNELRRKYKVLRMYNFDKKPKATKENALAEAMGGYVRAEYKYDKEFFKIKPTIEL